MHLNRVTIFAGLLLSIACTDGNTSDPAPIWRPEGEGFFDTPWPSDFRTDSNSSPALAGFPNPFDLPLIDLYIDSASRLTGFGTNSPIYFKLDGPLDSISSLINEASLSQDSAIQLIDVDVHSPEYGQRIPIQAEFFESTTLYLPGNLLSVGPAYGFPLRPATTYAVLITTDLLAPARGFDDVWEQSHPYYSTFFPLKERLVFDGISENDVAIATVFTTSNPVAEMADISYFIDHHIGQPNISQELTFQEKFLNFKLYTGNYPGPLFQHGEKPYTDIEIEQNGGFQFRESDGMPIIHSWENMRIAVSIPINVEFPPEDNVYPVVIYQHGTGGNYKGYANESGSLEVAAKLASGAVPMIGIGIDQPLHGTRGTPDTNVSEDTFNVQNPTSAQCIFRQGAIDALYLAKALQGVETSTGVKFTLSDNGSGTGPDEVSLDPSRILFMGHSQGGLTGAIALPWLGPRIRGAVLSGAGGGLSTTLIERKDPVDFKEAIEALLRFDADEDLTELHPISGLVQTLVEVTDPINYAPYWYHSEGAGWAQHPTSVLLTSGQADAQTPHRTAEHMAAAARMPIVSPAVNQPTSQDLRGLVSIEKPRNNAEAYDGTFVTSGLSQWPATPDGDHFVLFNNTDAARMYQYFLTSASQGEAVIDPVH